MEREDALLVEGDESRRHERKAKRHHRLPGVEASHIHGAHPAPEHLGSVLISAEAKPSPHSARIAPEKLAAGLISVEQAAGHPEQARQPLPNQRIDTLDRAELLDLSGKIVIDGSNLRQIYETHLIGEHGLRRLVAEHFYGGDLKLALQRELIEHEIDFERDPQIRDINPQLVPGATADDNFGERGKSVLDELLQRAAIDGSDDNSDATSNHFEHPAGHQTTQAGRSRQLRLTDIALAGLILVLLALVIMLILRG